MKTIPTLFSFGFVSLSLIAACDGGGVDQGNDEPSSYAGSSDSGGSGGSTGGASTGGKSSNGGSAGAGPSAGQGGSAGGSAGKQGSFGQGGNVDPAQGAGGAAQAGTSTMGNAGTSTSSDPFEAARELCVQTINMYRATKSLAPLQRWMSDESCVDAEATHDGMVNIAHDSFNTQHMCGSDAEDECPGYGPDPISALPGCLDQMWTEKDKAECSGCDSCAFPYENCTNCTFQPCGHYLNMSNPGASEVACGFWAGGWYAQDFQ